MAIFFVYKLRSYPVNVSSKNVTFLKLNPTRNTFRNIPFFTKNRIFFISV